MHPLGLLCAKSGASVNAGGGSYLHNKKKCLGTSSWSWKIPSAPFTRRAALLGTCRRRCRRTQENRNRSAINAQGKRQRRAHSMKFFFQPTDTRQKDYNIFLLQLRSRFFNFSHSFFVFPRHVSRIHYILLFDNTPFSLYRSTGHLLTLILILTSDKILEPIQQVTAFKSINTFEKHSFKTYCIRMRYDIVWKDYWYSPSSKVYAALFMMTMIHDIINKQVDLISLIFTENILIIENHLKPK